MSVYKLGEKLKILYFTSTGFDTPSANNHLVESFINTMLDQNLSVHMIAGRRSGKIPDVPASIAGREGFTIEVIDRGSVDKNKLFARLANELAFLRGARLAIMYDESKADIALVQSSPLALLHIGLIKKILKIPIVYNAYEIIPDYASEAMRRKLGPLYYLYKLIQREIYVKSDKIIAASEDIKSTLEGKGISGSKISVIPNWYNDSLVREVSKEDNRFIKQNNVSEEKFIIQYAGTIGFVFDIGYLIDIASALEKDANVEFHIIGDGARKNELISRVEKLGLTNVHFFSWQPSELIADVYSACNISLVPLAEGTIFNAYPSKSSLLMACGTPVIYSVEKESKFAQMVETNGLGFVVERGSVEETVDVIRRAKRNSDALNKMSFREKEYAKQHLRATELSKAFTDECINFD